MSTVRLAICAAVIAVLLYVAMRILTLEERVSAVESGNWSDRAAGFDAACCPMVAPSYSADPTEYPLASECVLLPADPLDEEERSEGDFGHVELDEDASGSLRVVDDEEAYGDVRGGPVDDSASSSSAEVQVAASPPPPPPPPRPSPQQQYTPEKRGAYADGSSETIDVFVDDEEEVPPPPPVPPPSPPSSRTRVPPSQQTIVIDTSERSVEGSAEVRRRRPKRTSQPSKP